MGRKPGATSDTIEEHSYRQGKYMINDPRKTSGSRNAHALK